MPIHFFLKMNNKIIEIYYFLYEIRISYYKKVKGLSKQQSFHSPQNKSTFKKYVAG